MGAIIFGGNLIAMGQFSSGAIVRGAIVQGTIFLGGNCPRTKNNNLKISHS